MNNVYKYNVYITIMSTIKNPDILVLTCIDFRTHDVIHSHMATLGYAGKYDYCSVVGSGLSLYYCGANVNDYLFLNSCKLTILSNIKFTQSIHGTKELWIFTHEDCRGCKRFDADTISSESDEKSYHTKSTSAIRCMMREINPDLIIKTFYIHGTVGTTGFPIVSII